jgi:hypothetical protein
MNTGEWIGLIVLASVVGGLIIGAIAVVTEYFRGRERDEMDATIKLEMLQRGMSAEEIIKVLQASSETHDPPPWAECEHRGRRRHSFSARRAMHEAMQAAEREKRHA